MTATLTPRERELARNALGLDGTARRQTTNSEWAHVNSPNARILYNMRTRGFAEITDICRNGIIFFRLTRAGALAALDEGERLDSEEFPG